jgi:HAD superfamily hydrolase (TIGR01509 family)
MGSEWRAIIFDFNGVISDDEPLHLEVMRRVLAEEGVTISDEDYWTKYIGRDDRHCFTLALTEAGRAAPDQATLEDLLTRKTNYYLEAVAAGPRFFPGVIELIERLALIYPLAIASGALRPEIEAVLAGGKIREHFRVVISSEDVSASKPDPEIYLHALAALNASIKDAPSIAPFECLVIEDSRAGIEAAHRAGMRCLAVATSFPATALAAADSVFENIARIDPEIFRPRK